MIDGRGHRLRLGRGGRRARRGDLICAAADRGRAPRRRAPRGRAWPAAPARIEADQLNGEIVLLGRLHGVPTPVNELLQAVAHELAARRRGARRRSPRPTCLARLG